MEKKFEFASGGEDKGAEKKNPKIVYPPEVQEKLDRSLANVEAAATTEDRKKAMQEYKDLVITKVNVLN